MKFRQPICLSLLCPSVLFLCSSTVYADSLICPASAEDAESLGFAKALAQKEQEDPPACNVSRSADDHYVSFPSKDLNWCALPDSAWTLVSASDLAAVCVVVSNDRIEGLFRKDDEERQDSISQISVNNPDSSLGKVFVNSFGPCSVDEDCSGEILRTDQAGRIQSLSSAQPRVRLPLIEGLVDYLGPFTVSKLLNDEPIDSVVARVERGFISLELEGDEVPVGRLELRLADKLGVVRQVELTLARQGGYDDNPTVLSLRIELALAKKLIADELFLQSEILGPVDPACRETNVACVAFKKYTDAVSV